MDGDDDNEEGFSCNERRRRQQCCCGFMKENGYDTIGVTMKLYDNEDINMSREKTCCSLSDIEDARSVAFNVGIPYYVFNFNGKI